MLRVGESFEHSGLTYVVTAVIETAGSTANTYKCTTRRSNMVGDVVAKQLKLTLPGEFRGALSSHEQLGHVFIESERLRHAATMTGIVEYKGVYQSPQDASVRYLLFEYCSGGDLFDRIINYGHYNEKAAYIDVMKIAKILSTLRMLKIVHGDIKPENFVFSEPVVNGTTGTLKLIDFGISNFGNVHFPGNFGTPEYMAPEVLRDRTGRHRTYASDAWSLGVMTYVMLSGAYPFCSEEEILSNDEVQFDKPSSSYWEVISEDAKDFIRRLLNKNPRLRARVGEALSHPWKRTVTDGAEFSDIFYQRLSGARFARKFQMTVKVALTIKTLVRRWVERVRERLAAPNSGGAAGNPSVGGSGAVVVSGGNSDSDGGSNASTGTNAAMPSSPPSRKRTVRGHESAAKKAKH